MAEEVTVIEPKPLMGARGGARGGPMGMKRGNKFNAILKGSPLPFCGSGSGWFWASRIRIH